MTEQIRRPGRKPVIALMGEFSAGKSTLANLLLGEGHSTVKVTATQMPPLWFTHGTGRPVQVDLDGNETEIAPAALSEVGVADTAHVRVFVQSPLLEVMDLIDMPGNSDPNMPAEVWQRAIHHATGVVWCTHANQAWRQSEAAVWEDLPDSLYPRSVLLLTRFDKILGDTNRLRVLRRVKAEAEDLFAGVYPISLTDALAAGDDREKWIESGAEDFLNALLDIVLSPGDAAGLGAARAPAGAPVMPRRVARRKPEGGEARRPSAEDAPEGLPHMPAAE